MNLYLLPLSGGGRVGVMLVEERFVDNPVSFARKLRREQTPAERRFWALLHPWRDAGQHWRRQAPIGPYIADFACKRLKLIIEIDGDTHYSGAGVVRPAPESLS